MNPSYLGVLRQRTDGLQMRYIAVRPGLVFSYGRRANDRFGSFADIHERLLSAISGHSDKGVFWELPTDHLMRDQWVEPFVWPAFNFGSVAGPWAVGSAVTRIGYSLNFLSARPAIQFTRPVRRDLGLYP